MAFVVVTGANRGIGLELCKRFHQRADKVVGVCRHASSQLKDIGCRIEEGIDVTSTECMSSLKKKLGQASIDILVNNAGILMTETVDDMDFEQITHQFQVNTLGPLRLTQQLLPLFSPKAKLVMITSRMGSIADNSSGGRYGYRMSKAALNMACVSLAIDLKPRGIAVAILHPGFVRTEMTMHQGLLEPGDSAKGLIARIDDLTIENTGKFWHVDGEELPW